jgi:hypothetical protein
MAFTDTQEKLIERAEEIVKECDKVIVDEYTRFNTIYVGNIKKDRVNLEIQLMYPAIAKLLNYDLNRYYQDQYYNFEKTMEYRIWHYENILDDSPFIGIYEMEHGVFTMEYAQLGMETRWVENGYPVAGAPVIRGEKHLDSLEVPDFFTTGFMPRVIEDYIRLKDDLRGRLPIGIRKFFHGPTQFSCDIYGIEAFYMDLHKNPGMIEKLYDFYVKFLRNWVAGWEKLHGRKYGMIHMAEDEIDTKFMISPEMYRRQILPYHVELGKEFGDVHWHSCGDVNNIMADVKTIPNIRMVEIGPATNAYEAAKVFKDMDVVFYKCADPVSEILEPQPGSYEKLFEDVMKASELVPIKILVETPDLAAGLRLLEEFRKWQ